MTDEPRYRVTVAISADGKDPGEAAQAFARHVTTYGLASLTYNVEDRQADEFFLATLSGSYAPARDVLDALDEDEELDVADPVVDPVPSGPPEEPAREEVEAACKRCGDMAVIGEDKMCAQCRADIQGVPT